MVYNYFSYLCRPSKKGKTVFFVVVLLKIKGFKTFILTCQPSNN